jgi:hemin uptake protein HemP
MDDKPIQPAAPPLPASSEPILLPTTFDASQLFAGQREIWIEHAGVRYRLRITRRNKLILQK